MSCANRRKHCNVHFTKAEFESNTEERFDWLRIITIITCFRTSSAATHVVKTPQLAKSMWTGRS